MLRKRKKLDTQFAVKHTDSTNNNAAEWMRDEILRKNERIIDGVNG
jgi:hypothetical protein